MYSFGGGFFVGLIGHMNPTRDDDAAEIDPDRIGVGVGSCCIVKRTGKGLSGELNPPPFRNYKLDASRYDHEIEVDAGGSRSGVTEVEPGSSEHCEDLPSVKGVGQRNKVFAGIDGNNVEFLGLRLGIGLEHELGCRRSAKRCHQSEFQESGKYFQHGITISEFTVGKFGDRQLVASGMAQPNPVAVLWSIARVLVSVDTPSPVGDGSSEHAELGLVLSSLDGQPRADLRPHKEALAEYLASASAVDPDSFDQDGALAYWIDLLLPETDSGVFVQLIIFAVLMIGAFWFSRRNQEWRLVVIGTALVGLGFIGFRALH